MTVNIQGETSPRGFKPASKVNRRPRNFLIANNNQELLVFERFLDSKALTRYPIKRENKFNEFSRKLKAQFRPPIIRLAPENNTVSMETILVRNIFSFKTWKDRQLAKERTVSADQLDKEGAGWTLGGFSVNHATNELVIAKAGFKPSLEIFDTQGLVEKKSIKLPFKTEDQISPLLGSLVWPPWISADGKMGASFQDHYLTFVDLENGKTLFQLPTNGIADSSHGSFSSDHSTFLHSTQIDPTGDKSAIEIIEVETQKNLVRLEINNRITCNSWVNGDLIAVGTNDPVKLDFRKASDLSLHKSLRIRERVISIAKSPTESVLACGGQQGTIFIVDLKNFSIIAEFKTFPFTESTLLRPIRDLRFTEDGKSIRYIASSVEGRIDFGIARDRISLNRPPKKSIQDPGP